MPSITTQQVTEVTLSPELKVELLNKLREFQANATAIKALEADQAALKVEVEGMVVGAGEAAALDAGFDIEGFKAKMVYPTRTSLDLKTLVAQGVTTQQIENATVTEPSKHYLLISTPKDAK